MAILTMVEETPVVSSSAMETKSPHPFGRLFRESASIVLVGTRGAGKRTLGFIGATHLGRRLITEDHYFQTVTGLSRGAYLQQYGNHNFYQRNIEVIEQMLQKHQTGCVIECGMGSLISQVQRILHEYSKTNPVIYITRESWRIRDLLRIGEDEASRLEIADLAHRHCSNLEYFNLYDSSCDGTETPPESGLRNVSSRLKYAKEDFSAFLDLLTGQGVIRNGFESPFSIAALPPECRSHTYALSLRLSTIPDLDLEELEAGADAVQLKIDAWVVDIQKVIGEQIAQIRRKLGVPIIFHVEEYVFSDARMTPKEKEHAYFELLEHGLRFGVEYIVVDLKSSPGRIARIVQLAGCTKVIGHYLAREKTWRWEDNDRMTEYLKAKTLGCNMVRFVRATSDVRENDAVHAFTQKFDGKPNTIPVIAYNLGEHGRPSLIANRILTPVTHPVMRTTVSKSQLRQYLTTAAEAVQALYQSQRLDSLHFLHLGASVFYSLSPAMHTAAYQACGMSHDFQSLQVASLEDIHRLCQDSKFGGAAITQPFKVQILSRIAAKSYHAKAIGAVNTLLPLRILPDGSPLDGSTESLFRQANNRSKSGPICAYYGDNTDFIGIMTCLRRNISPRNVVQPSKTTGLVIGAGGMARAAIYAMIQMGCRKIFVFNRTAGNAAKVAQHFNSWASGLSSDGEVVSVLQSRNDEWPEKFRQPTMIVSCVPARSVGNEGPANFEMPPQWLKSPTGGVVVDLAYLPLVTPLLNQMRELREETKIPWVIVDGLEVLPEQAIAQFELMTGKRAPKRRMRQEVLANYHNYER